MSVTVLIHFKELGDTDFTSASSQQYHFIPRIGDIVTPFDYDTVCKVIAVVPRNFNSEVTDENVADVYAVELPIGLDAYLLSLT